MIEVIVEYFNKKYKKQSNDMFIYPTFIVKGHANNGYSSDCIKVCAGVSACVIGIRRLIDPNQYDVKYEKGYFELRMRKMCSDRNDIYIDMDTAYALNTLLCQLYDLNVMYPSQFSRFDMYEVKEYDYARIEPKKDQEPKPFRRRKKIKLGVPSDCETTNC